MLYQSDTIVAIATPPGRGGIGIIRLSGPEALPIASTLLRLRQPLTPARARFGYFLDPEVGDVLDEVVATWFAAPHSYTGEDVVELALHGAPVLLAAAVRASVAGGARLAEPGEFTQRAFLTGRLDLTEAEAVHDLVAASTLQQARVAAAQLGGSLSLAISPSKLTLIELIATLEAGIDFAEDDVDLLSEGEIFTRIRSIQVPLAKLLSTWHYGRVLREGFTLAIVGRPNAGKSSLFNRLLGRDRAIVTPYPGTTRDPIHEQLSLCGIPVELVDTAGLREAPADAAGEAERQGIDRSRATLAEADLVLHVLDASTLPAHGEGVSHEDAAIVKALAGRPHLTIINKTDLRPELFPARPNAVSALTGEGLSALRDAILSRMAAQPPSLDSALVTNLRQHTALTQAVDALDAAYAAARNHLPHELLLLDLSRSLQALDGLTGVTTADDILRLIFSTFCIGK
jgi:tRNA modification GTPase